MATTATAGKPLVPSAGTGTLGRFTKVVWLRPGVRARQVALITLLVMIVVLAATVANIAYVTSVIVNRTAAQARQLTDQISYAVRQELSLDAEDSTVAVNYSVLAHRQSSVRELMESTIAASGDNPVVYLYLTDESGEVIRNGPEQLELSANKHMIGPAAWQRPDLENLAHQNAYVQLARVLTGAPIYEYRSAYEPKLHIGVSASAVRRELRAPIRTNLLIGLLAIVGAAVVALSSANLLLKPLRAISNSIDRLGGAETPVKNVRAATSQDDVVSGVTARLKQLGERIAGERSELEIMRGRLRQVISHLEERLLLINREGRVILASPDAEQLLGVDGSEMTGLPIDESLGAAHPIVHLVESSFASRRSILRTAVHVPFRSRSRQLIASVQYIEDGGEPVGALLSLRDFESFQRFELQWDLSKKLADLGRVTSGIAHEVKNPLNAMVIHLEILRSKIESERGDPAPQIEILESEIKRLDRVVQTFLNFTRPMELRLQPLDLNVVVNQVVTLASTEALERGISMTLNSAQGPLTIKGDPDLLKQTLLNIIINGCQAMPDGGTLEVTTSRNDDGTVRIGIRDHGVGIAPEGRDRIFTLFYTTKGGGTGIGLAQAFRAIQLHNGQIRFDSEVGVGSTFEIILPAST